MLLVYALAARIAIAGNRYFAATELEDIARLAIKCLADRFECRETHGFCFAVFQNRDVRHGNADFFCQFRDAHLAFCQHHVDIDYDRHDYTVKSFSDFIKTAWASNLCSRLMATLTISGMPTKNNPTNTKPGASSLWAHM